MTPLLLVDAQVLHEKHAVFKDLGPTTEFGWVRIAVCPHQESVVQIQIADLFFRMHQRAIFTSYEVITMNDVNGAYVAVVMSTIPVAQALVAKITVSDEGGLTVFISHYNHPLQRMPADALVPITSSPNAGPDGGVLLTHISGNFHSRQVSNPSAPQDAYARVMEIVHK